MTRPKAAVACLESQVYRCDVSYGHVISSSQGLAIVYRAGQTLDAGEVMKSREPDGRITAELMRPPRWRKPRAGGGGRTGAVVLAPAWDR